MKSKKPSVIVILALVALCTPATLSAQATEARWDSVYDKGSFIISPGIGFSYGFSIALYPSVELIVVSEKIDDYMPIDLGVSLKGVYNRFRTTIGSSEVGWDGYGGGLFGTIHLSFKNLEAHQLPMLENFDFYAGVGIVGNYLHYAEHTAQLVLSYPFSGIGFSTVGGVRYFLLDWLALNLEGSFWGYTGTAKLAVSFKL